MKNIPYPLPMGGIFEDNNFTTPYYVFIQYLLVGTQDLRTKTINGTFHTVNLNVSRICYVMYVKNNFNEQIWIYNAVTL